MQLLKIMAKSAVGSVAMGILLQYVPLIRGILEYPA
jgi:hypothetical protein